MKSKEALIASISLGSCSVLMVTSVLLGLYFSLLYHYPGTSIDNPFSEDDIFDINNIATLTKEKDKDFVILNLADVQMCDLEDTFTKEELHKQITNLVNEYKPNLITLSGDQTWSNENLISLRSLISWLDCYKIPFAPVFGNHDYGNDYNSAVASLNYCCDLYEASPYSLFKRGPSNLDSLGNYIINIKEDNKIINTLYMMDLGYHDSICEMQEKWFIHNAEGIKTNNNNEYTDGLLLTHRPLPEFRDAYFHYLNDPTVAESDVIVHMMLSDTDDTGFTEIAKSKGVFDFLCGHEHYNSFTINHENARYSFLTKTGDYGGSYKDDKVYLNGATTIKLTGNKPIIEHHYTKY